MRNKTHIAFESNALSPETTDIKCDPEQNIHVFSSTGKCQRSQIFSVESVYHSTVFKEEMCVYIYIFISKYLFLGNLPLL